MRQPRVIICPLISPDSGAPSAMSGKSASSTERSLTSAASIFRRFARSRRAFSTASFLLFAITKFQTTPWHALFRDERVYFEPKTGLPQRRKDAKWKSFFRSLRLCAFAGDFSLSVEVPKQVVHYRRDRDCRRFRTEDAAAERYHMEISSPCAFDLLVRPPAFRTYERGYLVGRRKSFQRIAATFGKHHTQTTAHLQRFKRHRQANFRHKRASRLFCRLERDALPTRHALRSISLIAQMNVSIK